MKTGDDNSSMPVLFFECLIKSSPVHSGSKETFCGQTSKKVILGMNQVSTSIYSFLLNKTATKLICLPVFGSLGLLTGLY